MYQPVNPYVGLLEVVQELKKKPEDVAADPDLTDELLQAIDRASRWVDEYTRRDFFFHDFTAAPIVFDQFTQEVYDREIFFPQKPILSITKVVLGADETTGTELIFNSDYYNDANRIYLLESSRQFVFNVDMPRDGSAALNHRRGWNLFRPGRLLFVRGTSGFPQARIYQMTPVDAAGQLSGFQISAYSAPPNLFHSVSLNPDTLELTVAVSSDAGGAIVLCSGTVDQTAGAQLITLDAVNNSGFSGQVILNYTADAAPGQALTPTPNTPTPVDTRSIPKGIDPKITTATRLVAAALSGHNRKEWVGLDGTKQSVVSTEIPKSVFAMLGRRMPILV